MAADDTNLTLDLALRVGELLLSSGAGAADTAATMLSITYACGLRDCEVDVTFTSLEISYQPSADAPSQTRMRQLRFRAVDYTRLTETDQLVTALIVGAVDRDEARSRLATMVSSPHRYPRWAVSLGWGVMAVGASLLIGGDALVALIALISALIADQMLRVMARRRLPAFYQQVAGGLLATLIAVGASATPVGVDPSLAISAGIITMLAGIAFVGAVQDALTGYYVTAGARGLEAILLTGGIIAGVSGGLAVADRFGVPIYATPLTSEWSELAQVLIGAAITSAAFAFASYAPIRSLLPVALVGVLGTLVYRLLVSYAFGYAWSTAVAAVLIGVVAYSLAGRFRVPSLVVVVCGITPLLPGLSIYRGLYLLADGSTLGLIALATALAIALALASGVILGEYIAQPLKREARRLEQRLAGPRLIGPWGPSSVRRARRRRHGSISARRPTDDAPSGSG